MCESTVRRLDSARAASCRAGWRASRRGSDLRHRWRSRESCGRRSARPAHRSRAGSCKSTWGPAFLRSVAVLGDGKSPPIAASIGTGCADPPGRELVTTASSSGNRTIPPLVGTCRAGRLHRTELVCPQHSSSSSRVGSSPRNGRRLRRRVQSWSKGARSAGCSDRAFARARPSLRASSPTSPPDLPPRDGALS